MSYPSHLQRYVTDKSRALRANPNNGSTECVKDIFQAAIEGDLECIEANLDLGVDINSLGQPTTVWGPRFEKSGLFAATPLQYACSYGREEAVTLLLQRGARVDQRSASGHTAKDYARRRNYMGILHQLDQYVLRAAASGQS